MYAAQRGGKSSVDARDAVGAYGCRVEERQLTVLPFQCLAPPHSLHILVQAPHRARGITRHHTCRLAVVSSLLSSECRSPPPKSRLLVTIVEYNNGGRPPSATGAAATATLPSRAGSGGGITPPRRRLVVCVQHHNFCRL